MKKILKQSLFGLSALILLFLLSSPVAYSQSLPAPLEEISFIQQKISLFLVYPQEAKINGWEGVVKVKFTLTRNGRIKEIDIAESSGYPLLDAAAILAIKDAAPYPFPEDYAEKELEIILPVSYAQSPSPVLPYLQKDAGLSQSQAQIPPAPARLNETSEEETYLAYPQETQAQANEMLKSEEPNIQENLLPAAEELNGFVELALKNNQPTKVAREEIEFEQIKLAEAERNLLPKLKIAAYSTDGEVYKVDYEENETRFEVSQPLFYGGRLINTLKQAKVSLEIAKRNYDRLKLDVAQKSEIAYYNLVANRMHIKLKEALLKEGKGILEKIEKLAAAEIIIPLELSAARSWLRQIQFQLDSIKQDLFMAELAFKQVLNIKEAPAIAARDLEVKKLNLDLDTCLDAAFKCRPEIYLSELTLKFHDYGKRIETIGNNAFTVDLVSSYGNYKGHYKTEPWKTSDKWYVGFKVSKPLGGSTMNSSYIKEKTEPRFGQTSPTASSTISAELNLLDNIQRLAERKRSEINLSRSLSDFDETLKTITFEVQDAFLNYQKAVLQLNTAQSEMEFRRNEVEVAKTRSQVGEASLSSALEALNNFSEAQTKYVDALANYNISVANLKKTTGYGIKI